ncbi:MAG: ABC transporter ATP-binding protein [Candidatus Diapherotrites archaeon]|nr:ABC transporter ATP-binding protein [Candidatus Diapherotrites archaeon]
MASLIEARNVTKKYKMDKVVVEALRGVSIKIEKGDFIVIVGPSGSGKSTLLHLLGALDRPTSGQVLVDGKDISKMDDWSLAMIRRKKIGFVFQSFNLIPTLNALENVMIPLEPVKMDMNEGITRARDLLELLDMKDRMLHKPGELSGGQRQRVSIARALINDPEIILADEPTGNLDTVTGRKVVEAMLHWNQDHDKTFVLVTHDPSLLDFATRKVYIRDGLIDIQENNRPKKNAVSYHK